MTGLGGILIYGEERVGVGTFAMGCESLPRMTVTQRALYDRAVAASGANYHDVLGVRVSETAIEVDAVDFDDAGWPVRTLRVTAARLFGQR